MNARTWRIVSLLMLMPAAAGVAQEATMSQNAPGTFRQAPSIENVAMPIARIEQPVLLDTQLEAMRGAVPGFNFVVVRDPGTAGDYPILPAMSLKNVTVGQFIEFIEASFSGVHIRRIDGPEGTWYAIRIKPDNDALARARLAKESNRVRFYALAEVINSLADANEPPVPFAVRTVPGGEGSVDVSMVPTTRPSRAERIKTATSELLSLIQTAIETVEDDREPYTLKIHEPTLTLLFKGSPERQAVLQDALTALYPQGRWTQTRTAFGSGSAGYSSDAVEAYRRLAVPQVPPRSSFAKPASPYETSTLTPNDFNAASSDLNAARKALADRMAELARLQDELQKQKFELEHEKAIAATKTKASTTKPAKE